MLEDYLKLKCKILDSKYNEYGDYEEAEGTIENLRVRDIPTMRRITHGEVSDADTMIWLSPDTVARRGSVIEIEGVLYQVEKLTKARRIDETEVQFVKCELKVIRAAIS